jgi:hypothetical protein
MEVTAALLTAAAPAASLLDSIGQGEASVIGSVLLLIGVILQTARADRKARTEITANPAPAGPPEGGPITDLDLVKYVRQEVDTAVEVATKDLRDKVNTLERQFASVRFLYRRTQQAFREYIRKTRATWDTAAHPPHVDEEIRQLLMEDDLEGTFTSDEVAQYRQDAADDKRQEENYG